MGRAKKTPDMAAGDNFRREVRMRQGYYDLMTQMALSEQIGIPQSTLSKRLAQPENFTVEELRRLVGGIKPDPFVMLGLLGYEAKDIRKAKEAVANG